MTSWRDNDKAWPPFASDKDRVEKLGSIPEPVLQECVRYQTTVEQINGWLKLSPEQRYQKRKKDWFSHDCSVHTRYGNYYASQEKPGCSSDYGCIEGCRYYFDTGSIDGEEVLSWYKDIIGDRDYEQLRRDNEQFLQEFANLLKKQANGLPMNIPYRKDYYNEYYPSIMDM
jgi:hypothetical protein